MLTKRITDYRYDLDYEWSAEVFCEIVKSLWHQMQAEQHVPANCRLHLPTTAEEMQDLILALQELDERINCGIPERMRLPTFVFLRMRDGTYILGIPCVFQTMLAAWTGLGQRPEPGRFSRYGWSQRSNDVVWFLKHYEQNYELLCNRVQVECYPRMLMVALSQIYWPLGFKLGI